MQYFHNVNILTTRFNTKTKKFLFLQIIFLYWTRINKTKNNIDIDKIRNFLVSIFVATQKQEQGICYAERSEERIG